MIDTVSLELKLNLLFVLSMATLVIICINGIARIIESLHTIYTDRKNDNLSNLLIELQDELLSVYSSYDLLNVHTLHHAFGKVARGVKPDFNVLKKHDNYVYQDLINNDLRYTGPYAEYRGKVFVFSPDNVLRDATGNMYVNVEGQLIEAAFFRSVATESIQEC